MSLITEESIESAPTSGATPRLSSDESAQKDAEQSPSVADSMPTDGLPHSVEHLHREIAEMQVQLHNLRTEVARSSTTAARTTQRTGIALIVALLAATFAIIRAVELSPAVATPRAETTVSAAANESVERKIGELASSVNRLSTRLEALFGTVDEQSQTLERAAKRNERPSTPSTATTASAAPIKLDCAKLPADIKAAEADFSIQFPAASAQILPGSRATLDGIGKMLALVPNHCIVIEGHADASGKTEKNIALSKARADAVLDYIAAKSKLDRTHLVAIGKGSSDPPAGTDALDPANRRVIFKMVPMGS